MTLAPPTVRFAGYEITPVDGGRLRLDGGAMFGIVPRPLWSRHIAPDDRNRIPLAMRCLLMRGHGRTVLVDTGVGTKADDRFRELYALDDPPGGSLVAALGALGVAPGDVTDVVLTHLHFDHGGGATVRGADGALALTFPGAAHHVQRRHWAWAHASTREAASFLRENLDPLAASGRLVLADGEASTLPNVSFVVVDGHTRGMQLPLIAGDEGALLYAADLLPTAAHVPLLWGMAYDIEPLATIREKERVLARAADEGWWVAFEHDTTTALARIARTEKGFEAVDRRSDADWSIGTSG